MKDQDYNFYLISLSILINCLLKYCGNYLEKLHVSHVKGLTKGNPYCVMHFWKGEIKLYLAKDNGYAYTFLILFTGN